MIGVTNQLPDKVQMTVTAEHLKRAIKARDDEKNWIIVSQCLIAQAAVDVFGKYFNSCAGDEIYCDLPGTHSRITFENEALWPLQRSFDRSRWDWLSLDAILQQLPVTFELSKVRKDERVQS